MFRIAMSIGLVVLSVLAGCAGDGYRDWADLQVGSILADRTRRTIDYLPDESLRPATRPATSQAYEKLPFTRTAPPNDPPITLQEVENQRGPLGPDSRLQDAPAGDDAPSGLNAAMERLQAIRRLGPPSPYDIPLRLDLFGCLEYAARHSRAYQDQVDSLYLTALDVTQQRHLFDPSPFAQSQLKYSGSGNADSSLGYQSAMRLVNTAGVKQNLPLGGQITAQAVHTLVNTLTGQAADGASAQFVLQGSIPLLRGAGMVNLEPLIQSERTLIYAIRDFENYRRSFVVSTSGSYFQLLSLQTSVRNRRLNLRNLDELKRRTEAFYKAGMQNYLEVQRSEQSKLQAESQLLSSEDQYTGALDNFKVLIGMPVTQDFDVVEVRLAVNVPRASEEEAIKLAELYRLDLQSARDRVDDARRSATNAQNRLLPDLTLDANASIGNQNNLQDIELNPHTANYQTGMTLVLPLDQVSQRNAYRRALISVDQASRKLTQLREQVTSDVRQSLRAINVAQENYAIQQRGISLAESRLEFSNEQMRLGKTTARDVVDAQQSLLDAQDQASQAYTALQTRVLDFMRNTGTLRVDPEAGLLGRAMDRAGAGLKQRPDQPTDSNSWE
jgi:outer membrane protein TolC